MTVAKGTIITASYYNSLQKIVFDILGTAGYNRVVSSDQVSISTIITALHWNKLKIDLNLCLIYQTGSSFSDSALPTMASGGLIYASTVNLYNLAVDEIQSNYYGVLVLTNGVFTHTRTTTWNSTIDCEISMDFITVANANSFFLNSGDLRLNLAQTTRTAAIDDVWVTNLTGLGTIIFNNSSTTSTGSLGVPANMGWQSMTTVYQLILDGSNITSKYTYYSSDDILVYMRKNAAGTGVIMKIALTNGNIGNITGGTQAKFGYMKTVDAPSPSYSVFSSNTFN